MKDNKKMRKKRTALKNSAFNVMNINPMNK